MLSTLNYRTNPLKKLVYLFGVIAGALIGTPAFAQNSSSQVNIVDPVSNRPTSNLGIGTIPDSAQPITTAPVRSVAPVTLAPAPSAAPTNPAPLTLAPTPFAAPITSAPAPSVVPTTSAPAPSLIPTTTVPTPSATATAVNNLTPTNRGVKIPSVDATTVTSTEATTQLKTQTAPSLTSTPFRAR